MSARASALPVTYIRPGARSMSFTLREIWQARELLYFLVWRDIKVRYKQTALGVAWSVLQPFLTMVVFTIFFGRLARVPSDGIPLEFHTERIKAGSLRKLDTSPSAPKLPFSIAYPSRQNTAILEVLAEHAVEESTFQFDGRH